MPCLLLLTYLNQKEKHGFLSVCGMADNQDSSISGQVISPRNNRADLRLSFVFPDDKILSADKHASRPVCLPWNADQEIGTIVHWLAEFPHDVVQSKVQLIKSQMLLCFGCSLPSCILKIESCKFAKQYRLQNIESTGCH